jgi:hypothetical protein
MFVGVSPLCELWTSHTNVHSTSEGVRLILERLYYYSQRTVNHSTDKEVPLADFCCIHIHFHAIHNCMKLSRDNVLVIYLDYSFKCLNNYTNQNSPIYFVPASVQIWGTLFSLENLT